MPARGQKPTLAGEQTRAELGIVAAPEREGIKDSLRIIASKWGTQNRLKTVWGVTHKSKTPVGVWQCPLYPRERKSNAAAPMSTKGQNPDSAFRQPCSSNSSRRTHTLSCTRGLCRRISQQGSDHGRANFHLSNLLRYPWSGTQPGRAVLRQDQVMSSGSDALR